MIVFAHGLGYTGRITIIAVAANRSIIIVILVDIAIHERATLITIAITAVFHIHYQDWLGRVQSHPLPRREDGWIHRMDPRCSYDRAKMPREHFTCARALPKMGINGCKC